LTTKTAPTLADIQAARERTSAHARLTPVYGSDSLSRLAGRGVLLKAENLQRTGSFKVRGAYNLLGLLSAAEREAGVVAASAGNHGQAVACAAQELGIHATIFMPEDAPMAKVEATQSYHADVVLVGAGFDESHAASLRRVEETGATYAHPFEDERVIAGQGTIGLELAEQIADLGTVLVPVGGGGLASGIAIALRALRPSVRIVGVQIDRSSHTIADGIAVKHPGELTMSILDELLDDLVEVDDEAISEAITLLLERTKLVVEGAGAVSVAALLAGKAGGSGPACALLSGGNIDPTSLISVMRHGLTVAGRYLVIRCALNDRPGELIKLLNHVAAERGNIVRIEHHREGLRMDVGETAIELTIVMRNEEHCLQLLDELNEADFKVTRIL
jgi:threonine dehydratase